MQQLGILFGGEAQVRLMRTFLFNPVDIFDSQTLAVRIGAKERDVTEMLSILQRAELIKRKSLVKEIEVKKGKKVLHHKKKSNGFMLDPHFPYLMQLQNLLINTNLLKHDELAQRLGKAGKIKLLIAAGVFIQDSGSRADLLIVGDNLRKASLEKIVRGMESEIGKELVYAAFETTDFHYRISMYDKLLRDILDYPHQKLINKLGV